MGLTEFLKKRAEQKRQEKEERKQRLTELALKIREAEFKGYAEEKLRRARIKGKEKARPLSEKIADRIGNVGAGLNQMEKNLFPEFSGGTRSLESLLGGPKTPTRHHRKKKR